jgi:DNA modification methylase
MEINRIYCSDAITFMKTLQDEYVDLVFTSPPYWGLRDYGEHTKTVWGGNPNCNHEWKEERTVRPNASGGKTNAEKRKVKGVENYSAFTDYHDRATYSNFCIYCGAWHGQLGLEPHPQMYIDHLVEISREVRRILKKSGSYCLVLGDTYCSSSMGTWSRNERKVAGKSNWLQPKQLLGIPGRVMSALQDDGWICRNDVIWEKGNPMPSPVKDRRTTTYEHVYHFVKNRRYYFDLDSIRVPHKSPLHARGGRKKPDDDIPLGNRDRLLGIDQSRIWGNPLGKNPGDVILSKYGDMETEKKYRQGMSRIRGKRLVEKRNLPSQKEFVSILRKHFTVDSIVQKTSLPRTKVEHWFRFDQSGFSYPSANDWKLLGTPLFPELSQVWFEPDDVKENPLGRNPGDLLRINTQPFKGAHFAVFPEALVEEFVKSCCPPDGLVFDPFVGSGTTCLVAWKLGRNFLGCDLNPEYVKMARERLKPYLAKRLI